MYRVVGHLWRTSSGWLAILRRWTKRCLTGMEGAAAAAAARLCSVLCRRSLFAVSIAET